MEKTSVEDKVKEIVKQTLGVSTDQVVPEADLIETLGADSLDIVELTMSVEEEFGIDITDIDMEDINTVSGLIEMIKIRS